MGATYVEEEDGALQGVGSCGEYDDADHVGNVPTCSEDNEFMLQHAVFVVSSHYLRGLCGREWSNR